MISTFKLFTHESQQNKFFIHVSRRRSLTIEIEITTYLFSFYLPAGAAASPWILGFSGDLSVLIDFAPL